MLEEISVRVLRSDEWALFKAVRLKALLSDPSAFWSAHEKEVEYADHVWQEKLNDSVYGIFGAFYRGDIIGMTGIKIHDDQLGDLKAELWGSWLEKEWRGKGVSKKLYEARVDWAKQRPEIKTIIVGHREENISSMKAIQKHGFLFTHKTEETWPDGIADPCYIYELRLDHVTGS